MPVQPFSRREFLRATAAVPLAAAWAAAAVGPMKITKVEAVRFRRDLRIQGLFPNWTWVRLYTDAGLIGIGESYPTQEAHIGALREIAPLLLKSGQELSNRLGFETP